MHPALDGTKPVAAVRRWRSPVEGPATIALQMERPADQGDGVRAKLTLDGKEIYGTDLGTAGQPKRRETTLTVDLRKGSTVEFAVLPASGRLDFDNTTVRIRITAAVPAVMRQVKQ